MTPDAQQPQRECDGDCLSCDTDTYISCEKRINPDMKYTALERLDIKFSELIGAIEEKQVDGQLSSKDHGDYELICYCRGFIKAELERERRTRPHTPAPTDEQCRICSDAIARTATIAEREELLNDIKVMRGESVIVDGRVNGEPAKKTERVYHDGSLMVYDRIIGYLNKRTEREEPLRQEAQQ